MATALDKQSFKLEQCLERVVDNRGKTPPLSESGIELLEVNAIIDGRKSPAFENVRKYVSEETYATWFRSGHPRRGDTLISTVGAIGRVAFVLEERGCIAQNVVSLRPKLGVLDGEFLYYYLSSTDTQNRLLSLNIGVAQPSLKVPHLLSLAVEIPTLPIQRRIAGILSAYDELIENSQRRIKILEAMARALYREWFVHFRFPGHESVPRVPSPLGDIPQGWEVTTLGRLVEIRKGKNITKGTIREGGVPVVAGGITPAYFHDTANTQSPVITISASGANAGFVNLYYVDVWASDCSYIDLSATPHVFYFYLWLDHQRAAVTHLQRGSAQPHVYPKDLAQLSAVRASEEVLDLFAAHVRPIFGLIMQLGAEIENLRRTRDLLLPRLLSGQIALEAMPS